MADHGHPQTAEAPYVLTLGETMGLFYSAEPAPLEHAHVMRVGLGGAESNVAVGLRRLGVPSVWVGRVGNDSLGAKVVRELRAEAVDVDVVVDATAPTGLMIKERRRPDATTVWYYRAGSAGSRLHPDDLLAGRVENAALLHVTGITPALSRSAADAVAEAVARARAAQVPVSFDVNHRSRLWDAAAAAPTYRKLAADADIVFAGMDEGSIVVSGAPSPESLAEQLAALGPGEVVIKLGAHGALVRCDGQVFHQAATPVSVVDTVGAGDAFVAGYLAERVRGAPVEQRLATAVTAGAFACLSAGDWEGLPQPSDLHGLGAADPVTR